MLKICLELCWDYLLRIVGFRYRQRHKNEGGLRGKKGVCLTMRSMGRQGSWVENLPKLLSLRPCWNYTWSPKGLGDFQPRTIIFAPMIWGYKSIDDLLGQVEQLRKDAPSFPFLLGFNEPDHVKQSNLTVESALEGWSILQRLDSVRLVSPSCANSLGPWMEEFFQKAKKRNLRIDIVGVHMYMGPNFAAFVKRLNKIHDKYRLPLILTEFAVADWQATSKESNRYTRSQVLEFLREALPWLEATPWIYGYAWFSFSVESPHGTCSALFDDSSGKLTSIGKFYAQWKESPSPILHNQTCIKTEDA